MAIERHLERITDLELLNASGDSSLVATNVGGDIVLDPHSGKVLIDDDAYDAGTWNGSLAVPTKNAIRDKIETLQPIDADLTAIAALTPSNDDVIQRKSGAWTNRTIAQLLTDLGLASLYQPLDSDLTSIAALSTTSFGRGLLALANAAALRTSAGLASGDAVQVGSLGVGVAPGSPLVTARGIVNGQEDIVRWERTADGAVAGGLSSFYDSENSIAVGSITNHKFKLFQNGTTRVTIDTSGNVIIGTTAAGTSAAKVLGIANGTAPSSSPANMIQLWSDSGELKVRDASGNVTTLSPHAGDAPEWMYDDDQQPPHISREANMFAGTIRFVNHTRASRLQQMLFDGQLLPESPLLRKTIYEETFDQYNERLGLKPGDAEFLSQESWEANEELNDRQSQADIAGWREDRRVTVRENLRRRLAQGEAASIPSGFRIPRPTPYQRRNRPGWLRGTLNDPN